MARAVAALLAAALLSAVFALGHLIRSGNVKRIPIDRVKGCAR